MMMRMRTKASAPAFTTATATATATAAAADDDVWEVRPGGMLVQKRSPNSESASDSAPIPTLRIKVKHESAYHEIYISSQSTFGELKKILSERTGLHPQDQKIVYKDRERESSAYLDMSGVKDRSKMVLMADPTAHAKRVLEMRRAAMFEKAAKSVSAISSEVDRLASQVSAMEAIVSKGRKVADIDVLNLIEQLMTQLIKLDGIVADGDVKLQKGMQVRRVQKYVEMLDALKIKNAKITTPMPSQQQQQQQQQKRMQPPQSVVVTTDWETFDSLFHTPTSAATSTTTATSTTSSIAAPRFDWELF